MATPAASPVSTQATVAGQCTAGIYDLDAKAFYSMARLQSTEPVAGVPANSTEAEAYQLVLTNTGSTAAEVNGFSVVFYTGGDTETTSDTQTFYSPTFLEPGQSLQWTETPWGTYGVGDSSVGPFTKGSQGAVDTSATCQLAQWTHP